MSPTTHFIEHDWRGTCLALLAADGYTCFAPVRDGDVTQFMPCETADHMLRDVVNTDVPMKDVFFPRTETLLTYQLGGEANGACHAENTVPLKIAVFGGRPCDAASLAVLDQVFNWDYADAQYNARRADSLVLSVGCRDADPHCFCTTLGVRPDGTEGSDWLIQELDTGGALVTPCSDKGRALAETHAERLQVPPTDAVARVAEVPARFDVETIKPWLDTHFDDPFWEETAMACMGCAACSYLCPTCHCFDIVDEGNWQGGERRRNYDYCSAARFTLHASGHNPRPSQSSRCRNRVLHKFQYFPDRFDRRACVGCGRCTRHCGAGRNLVTILKQIEARALAAPAEEATA